MGQHLSCNMLKLQGLTISSRVNYGYDTSSKVSEDFLSSTLHPQIMFLEQRSYSVIDGR